MRSYSSLLAGVLGFGNENLLDSSQAPVARPLSPELKKTSGMFKGFAYAARISAFVIQYSWILELVALVGGQCLFGNSITQSSSVNVANVTNERSGRIQIRRGASRGISGSVGLGNFVDL